MRPIMRPYATHSGHVCSCPAKNQNFDLLYYCNLSVYMIMHESTTLNLYFLNITPNQSNDLSPSMTLLASFPLINQMNKSKKTRLVVPHPSHLSNIVDDTTPNKVCRLSWQEELIDRLVNQMERKKLCNRLSWILAWLSALQSPFRINLLKNTSFLLFVHSTELSYFILFGAFW